MYIYANGGLEKTFKYLVPLITLVIVLNSIIYHVILLQKLYMGHSYIAIQDKARLDFQLLLSTNPKNFLPTEKEGLRTIEF